MRHDLSAEQAHTLAEHLAAAKHEETTEEADDETTEQIGGADFAEENDEQTGAASVIEFRSATSEALDADAEIEEEEAAHEEAEDAEAQDADAAHEQAEDAADEADAAHEAAEAELEHAETALTGAGDREGVSPSPQQEPRSARIENRNRPRFQRPMRRGRGGTQPCGAAADVRKRHHAPQRRPQLISEMLKAGQEIMVQIAKEPLGKKGARITSHVALPGRFLVYMPTVNHIGVSRRIGSAEERSRLRRLVTESKALSPADSSSAPRRKARRTTKFAPTWNSSAAPGRNSHALRAAQGSVSAASRSQPGRAHPARLRQQRLHRHLDR